jgi:hypothetical protein
MRAVMAKVQARNVLIPIYLLECQRGMVLTVTRKRALKALARRYGTQFAARIALQRIAIGLQFPG